MDSVQYSEFLGLDVSTDPIDTPQMAFLKLKNVIPTRIRHALVCRGGSEGYAVTGDIWGLFGYSKETGSALLPVKETILRHRRTAAISFIEKLNWTTGVWSALTLGANTSFDIGDLSSHAQIGTLLAINGGKPAKITDIDFGTVTRLGGSPPATAATLATFTPGSGLTGTFSYFYTFYDSTTGWESSPSPLWYDSVRPVNQPVVVGQMQTTSDREGVNKKRIYRTAPTGEAPYFFVAEVDLSVIDYYDSIPDTALSVIGPDFNDQDPPPISSYIIHAHEDRFWIVDANNPRQLYYSKPYGGLNKNLEYYSPDRLEVFPKRVTGLMSRPGGGLLIFQPPGFGIYELQGRTESEFTLTQVHPKEGTNFKATVCTDGEIVSYWSEDGPAFLYPDGSIQRKLSYPLRNYLREALLDDYTGKIFVWGQYSNANKQFIFGFSAGDSTGSAWIDEQTGLPVTWIEEDSGAVVDWVEDIDNSSTGSSNWWGEHWFGTSWYGNDYF